MSDSFLYSGDDAVMMSDLQHCHVAVGQHSGMSSERETGLSVGTSMALSAECRNVHAKGIALAFTQIHIFNNSRQANVGTKARKIKKNTQIKITE